MIKSTNWLRYNYSTLNYTLWLAPSQLLIKSGHLPLSLSNWTFQRAWSAHPWKFVQLVLALGPTTHIEQLHLAILVRSLLFLWEVHCFPCLFRCLLLKFLSHPKLSHSVIAPLTRPQSENMFSKHSWWNSACIQNALSHLQINKERGTQ
jgi:hypothetical protein